MSHKLIIFIACVSIAALSYAWSEYLHYRYDDDIVIEPINLHEKTSYSWSFTPTVSENYELVVRFYKNAPPPYTYVTEIIDKETYRGAPIDVDWGLMQEDNLVVKGGVGNYGRHFVAANPYVEKGIGSFSLSSGLPYELEFNVPAGYEAFEVLAPEVRITHDVATNDWLFGQHLIAAFITIIGLATAGLVAVFWMASHFWKRYAGS